MKVYNQLASPTDTRPIDTISQAQIGLILGLENVLHDAALVLVCPRCAQEQRSLQTRNAPEDTVWKIDCPCRRRRINVDQARPMPQSGWLLLMVSELLGPLGLDVRCPSPRCLAHPLVLRETAGHLVVECRCQASRKFRKTPTTRLH